MKQPQSPKTAFTLIELLVVIAIIVLLISMLVPALESAVATAQRAKCMAHLDGIGIAMASYLNDSRRIYPIIYGWNGLFGARGLRAETDQMGSESDERPLNEYLGFTARGASVKIAECPSDIGQQVGAGTSANMYIDTGTSYQQPSSRDYYGIRPICGTKDVNENVTYQPMSGTMASPTHTKIVTGDWDFYGNRRWKWAKNRWHDNKPDGENRRMNILFADGHASFFSFPLVEIDDDYGNFLFLAANPNRRWW